MTIKENHKKKKKKSRISRRHNKRILAEPVIKRRQCHIFPGILQLAARAGRKQMSIAPAALTKSDGTYSQPE